MRLLTLFLGWLLVLLAGVVHGQATANDLETSPTLVIGATDFQGSPVEGARFVLTMESGGKETVSTDENGQAVAALLSVDEICHVVLEGEDPITSPPEAVSGAESRALAFLVFTSPIESMSVQQRRAFADHYADYLEGRAARRRERGTIETPSPATPDRVLAFLGGWRREGQTIESSSPNPRPDGTVVSARLLDEFGGAVAGIPVSLYYYDETLQALALSGYEETDEAGIVLFEGCDPARLHRVDVALNDGRVGSSPVFRPPAGAEPLVLAPIILWPAEKRISGLIYDGENPVRGAAVQIQNGSRVRLSTTTDELGNFLLAPVTDFPGEVVIRQADSHDNPVKQSCSTGMQEYLISLDLLEKASTAKGD